MRKTIYLAASLIVIILLVISCSGIFTTQGDQYCQQALRYEGHGDYARALELFSLAKIEYEREQNGHLSRECRFGYWRAQKIMMSYPHTLEAVRQTIKRTYPTASNAQINQVIEEGRLDHLKMGKTTYYFADFLNTLYHLYPGFLNLQEHALGKGSQVIRTLLSLAKTDAKLSRNTPYFNPTVYLGMGTAKLKRSALPREGIFQVWIPLPVRTPAQDKFELLSVEPAKYVKAQTSSESDIGLVYLEIPLAEIKNDLRISVKYKFRHFAQRFKINPAKIGKYDRQSKLFRQYTRSANNIVFDAAIRDIARKVAGSEKNPYLIAQKLYYHVVDQTDYSYVPHLALEVLKIPESIYVQRHRYGDCGSQSAYFAALCRSLGIPARCPGGLQTFPGARNGAGDHFWAEFYLPGYGWIPADTSAGQLCRYMPGLSEQERKVFKAYFFGGQDNCRWQIQNDLDVPVSPAPSEPLFSSLAIQEPIAVCTTMPENAGKLLSESWRWQAKRLTK
jgi:transglutaminase-like putative cysteine protease